MNADEFIERARSDLNAAERALVRELDKVRTRQRASLMRGLHEVRRMLNPAAYPYASQAGQDFVVDRLFKGKRDGTFVDVGGYDGVTGSNTLFFEHWRGWTGVLVEPVQAQLDKARVLRRCPCLQHAVADSDGTAEFVEVTEGFTQMSGLAGSYDASLLARVRQDPRHRERTVTVETRTLSRILTEAGIPDPDFVSLDIEGGEAAVLAGFPFARHRVGAWAIENNTGSDAVSRIMKASGHVLVELCGPDEIWRLSDL